MSMAPFPHVLIQVEAYPEDPVQVHPASIKQAEEHPSPSILFPVSHSSPLRGLITWFPQISVHTEGAPVHDHPF
jgi:hypothetical protein